MQRKQSVRLPEELVQTWHAGQLIAWWRREQGMSQIELALEAGLSSRHLSFIESGRSVPGEHVLESISGALSLSLRSRARLFDLAGYRRPADIEYATSADDDLEYLLKTLLESRANQLLLIKDPGWRLIGLSTSARRLLDLLLPQHIPGANLNILQLILSPDYLRPSMESWRDIASDLLLRVKHELSLYRSPALEASVEQVMDYPGVAELWSSLDVDDEPRLSLDYDFVLGTEILRLRSMVFSLGPAYDPILRGFRIDMLVPADPISEKLLLEKGIIEQR